MAQIQRYQDARGHVFSVTAKEAERLGYTLVAPKTAGGRPVRTVRQVETAVVEPPEAVEAPLGEGSPVEPPEAATEGQDGEDEAAEAPSGVITSKPFQTPDRQPRGGRWPTK